MGINAGLIVFCWGDENADPGTIRFLKELGLHGVIYDKIHEYNSKEVKESIFLVEARESQKQLLRLTAETAEKPKSPPAQPIIKERILNYEAVKDQLGDRISTATSLESLESRTSDEDKDKDKPDS